MAEKYPNDEFIFIKRSVGGTSLYGCWNPDWTYEKANQMNYNETGPFSVVGPSPYLMDFLIKRIKPAEVPDRQTNRPTTGFPEKAEKVREVPSIVILISNYVV